MPRDAETLPHQRADGRLHLVMGRQGLVRLHHRAPLRALFPEGERRAVPEVAMANVAGGLAGGDAVAAEVELEPGASATLTGAAAEKIYRSLGADTRVTSRLTLGEGAALEWLPQETILFEGARLARRMEVTLAPKARLLATEMLVFGRVARRERFATGFLRDAWRVRGPAGLLWADALRLDDPAGPLASPFGLAGAEACALLLLAAEDAAAHRDFAREVTQGQASLVRPGLLLLRWLGPAVEVRGGLRRALPVLRAAAMGGAACLPRLWTC